MLRKIVTAIILIPIIVLFIGFAVANRQIVSVSFDPFDQSHPAYALTLPLFGIVFVLLIVGVVIGGIASWLRQGRWRRSARKHEAEAAALREEIAALRAQRAVPPAPADTPLIPPPAA
jgi:uncharacterized integral membrane protein